MTECIKFIYEESKKMEKDRNGSDFRSVELIKELFVNYETGINAYPEITMNSNKDVVLDWERFGIKLICHNHDSQFYIVFNGIKEAENNYERCRKKLKIMKGGILLIESEVKVLQMEFDF